MSLTKRIEIDRIEIVGPARILQIREATVVMDDDIEVSRGFKRWTVAPFKKKNDLWSEADVSAETDEIGAICNAVWTDATKQAFRDEFIEVE